MLEKFLVAMHYWGKFWWYFVILRARITKQPNGWKAFGYTGWESRAVFGGGGTFIDPISSEGFKTKTAAKEWLVDMYEQIHHWKKS